MHTWFELAARVGQQQGQTCGFWGQACEAQSPLFYKEQANNNENFNVQASLRRNVRRELGVRHFVRQFERDFLRFKTLFSGRLPLTFVKLTAAMVKKKRASKRIPLKMKYKIEKNVSAKSCTDWLSSCRVCLHVLALYMLLLDLQVKNQERKLRKGSKLHPSKGKKLSKDPGIPNLHPFKTQLMAQVALRLLLVHASFGSLRDHSWSGARFFHRLATL